MHQNVNGTMMLREDYAGQTHLFETMCRPKDVDATK